MMSPPRSPSRSRAPRLRVVAALAVLASASACAAVLGIGGDFREGEGVSAGTDGGDAFSDARACDAADPSCLGDASDPSKVCDPSSCAAAGGTCTRGSCLLACVGGCADQVFTCPPGADCTIGCTDQGSCSAARCQGGRSCTFECSGNASCKQGISCESERCEFRCTAESDSCKDGPPLSCDASVCIADCAGKNACNRGVNANASAYCGITCSGTPSCNSPGAPILCISPDASIVCTNARDTCKDGKPSCYAQNCSIECLGPTSCSAGLCCDAGTCALDSSAAKANVCP